MSARTFFGRFLDKFFKDETTTLAASLAFYAALSLAPLVILFVAISSRLSDRLQTEFLQHTQTLVGNDAAQAVQIVIEGAKSRTDLTSMAGLLGAATLLVSASLIFGQLRVALNRIFGVIPPDESAAGTLRLIWDYLKERATHIVLALVCIAGVIATLIATSVLSATLDAGHTRLPVVINIGVSFVFYTFLFTAIFRYMPDRRQPWRCALQGGALTALLFEAGKELIGVYLGRSAIGSAYGAAGSLIVLLVWVYYSTLITFVGAQVSSILMRIQPGRPA